MTSAQDIFNAIVNGNFTDSDLRKFNSAIKLANSKLARVNSYAFNKGSKAKLTHKKLGGTVVVTVNKIKISKADITVDSTGEKFIVPLSMLQAA